MQLNIELNVSPRHVFFALVGTSIFFLIFDAIVYSFSQSLPRQFRELVDITKESNLPTWFSSTQLLFVGLCAYFVGNFKRRQGEQKKALGWFVIAVFFAYMGIDDTSQLHERVSTVIAEVVNQSSADILLIAKLDVILWDATLPPTVLSASDEITVRSTSGSIDATAAFFTADELEFRAALDIYYCSSNVTVSLLKLIYGGILVDTAC